MNPDTRYIALQRIQTLFALANQKFREDKALAQRYVDLARKIAMAARIHMPREYRRQVCRHCKSFMMPGVNCRVRTRNLREPHVTITCLSCGKQTRIPTTKKKRGNKSNE